MKFTHDHGSDARRNRQHVEAHGKNWGLLAVHGSVSGYLLHTDVIISTRSTFEWPVTSVLGVPM